MSPLSPCRAPRRVAAPWGAMAALWCACAGLAHGEPSPEQWLERADRALAHLSYRGVFVHEHAGTSETQEIIHRVGPDGIDERLVSMDGSGREFIRKGGQLWCYLPDQRTVLVERNGGSSSLLGALRHIDLRAADLYQVRTLARTRISGREVRIVAVVPLDALRYGYRLWIDERSGLPLRTQLLDVQGEVLEQILFTQITVPARISDVDLNPSVDARSFRWLRQDADQADMRAVAANWQYGLLPPGFRLTSSAHQLLPGGPVEHLVFTDGLASVSVFVQLGHPADPHAQHDLAGTVGFSSTYSTVVQGFRVTAVGEVPAATVRAIAQSVHSAPDATIESIVNQGADPALLHGAAASADGVQAPGEGIGGAARPRPGPDPGTSVPLGFGAGWRGSARP